MSKIKRVQRGGETRVGLVMSDLQAQILRDIVGHSAGAVDDKYIEDIALNELWDTFLTEYPEIKFEIKSFADEIPPTWRVRKVKD